MMAVKPGSLVGADWHSLPTACIGTLFFGTAGILIADLAKIRITVRIGALTGILCGLTIEILWVVFLAGENFYLSALVEGFAGKILLPISVLGGCLIGMGCAKLVDGENK